MKARHWITGIVLLLLVASAIVGIILTREQPPPTEEEAATPAGRLFSRKAQGGQRQLVDIRPLQTARRMSTLAGTPEEQTLAHEAEKVGDHEVDLEIGRASCRERV